MSTIASTFAACREQRRLALIPYLTGGFPSLDGFREQLQRVSAGGADIIEIGIPFSDPIADGPTIQYSSQVALKSGATLTALLDLLAGVTLPQPLVFMSYLNPLLAYGRDRLLPAMRAARVSGLIIPDLPVEEADEWQAATIAASVDLIFLAAPTSTDERLKAIAARARGFIYAVSRAGVTGARSDLSAGLGEFLKRIRAHTQTPIAVGFGVSTVEHVRALRGLADGAVVGSRLVEAIRAGEDVGAVVREFRVSSSE